MDIEEYNAKCNTLYKEYHAKMMELACEFAMSNNQVSIGDTIEDHTGKIVVEKISLSAGQLSRPLCKYYGKNLLKSGKQSKREPHRTVYQSNLIRQPAR